MTYFCFFVIANPSGSALALREAIPHSSNENRVHSITQEKGQLRNPPTGYASLPTNNPVLIVIVSPALVCRESGEAIPCSRSGNKVHAVHLLEGMAS